MSDRFCCWSTVDSRKKGRTPHDETYLPQVEADELVAFGD
jgi:hypothetical protein